MINTFLLLLSQLFFYSDLLIPFSDNHILISLGESCPQFLTLIPYMLNTTLFKTLSSVMLPPALVQLFLYKCKSFRFSLIS